MLTRQDISLDQLASTNSFENLSCCSQPGIPLSRQFVGRILCLAEKGAEVVETIFTELKIAQN